MLRRKLHGAPAGSPPCSRQGCWVVRLMHRHSSRSRSASTGPPGRSTAPSISRSRRAGSRLPDWMPSVEDGNGSVTTVQIVGSGSTFDVGHAALASMMIARDKGLPVKAVAVFARHSDIGLLVPEESGINGPTHLKGKKVVYTAGSLEAPFIDAFLAAGGLKRSDLELINVDAAGKVATYSVGPRRRGVLDHPVRPAGGDARPGRRSGPLRRLRAGHAELRPVRHRGEAGGARRGDRAFASVVSARLGVHLRGPRGRGGGGDRRAAARRRGSTGPSCAGRSTQLESSSASATAACASARRWPADWAAGCQDAGLGRPDQRQARRRGLLRGRPGQAGSLRQGSRQLMMQRDTAPQAPALREGVSPGMSASAIPVARGVQALDGIDAEIPPGAFVSILGPSGCGKSTFLRCIAGLETISGGELLLDGRPVDGPPDGVGIVFQRDALLEWRNIRRNILLPIEFAAQAGRAVCAKGRPSPRADRSAGVRRRLSARAVRRHAAARGDLPRAGRRPGAAADGRAVRRARRADARPDERRAAAHLAGRAQHGGVRHPRHRRGGVPRRPSSWCSPRAPAGSPKSSTIDLPRPRPLAVRESPEFSRYVARIRTLFEDMGLIDERARA